MDWDSWLGAVIGASGFEPEFLPSEFMSFGLGRRALGFRICGVALTGTKEPLRGRCPKGKFVDLKRTTKLLDYRTPTFRGTLVKVQKFTFRKDWINGRDEIRGGPKVISRRRFGLGV